MTRRADLFPHALHCRCARCARMGRVRGTRLGIAAAMLSGVLVLLVIGLAFRSLL